MTVIIVTGMLFLTIGDMQRNREIAARMQRIHDRERERERERVCVCVCYVMFRREAPIVIVHSIFTDAKHATRSGNCRRGLFPWNFCQELNILETWNDVFRFWLELIKTP